MEKSKTPVEEMLERRALRKAKTSSSLWPHLLAFTLFLSLFLGVFYWWWISAPAPVITSIDNIITEVAPLNAVEKTVRSQPEKSIVAPVAELIIEKPKEGVRREVLVKSKEEEESTDLGLALDDLDRMLKVEESKAQKSSGLVLAQHKVEENTDSESIFDELDQMLTAESKSQKSSGLKLTADSKNKFTLPAGAEGSLGAVKGTQVRSSSVVDEVLPKRYNGWSFQEENLPNAPDFKNLYQPEQLNSTRFRNYISLTEAKESGYVITHNFLRNISTYQLDESGNLVQKGSRLITLGETPRSVARQLLDFDYKFEVIDAKTYQSLLAQIDHFSNIEMNQSQIDWLEKVLKPEIEESLTLLPSRIKDWRHYDTHSVPGILTHSYYHDEYKQTIKVSFENRSFNVLSTSFKPEMINGFFWYKIPTFGGEEYVFFPESAPTHKISLRISSYDQETLKYSLHNFDFAKHYEFIEFLMQKYGTRQLAPYSWEFWSF